MNTAKILVIDDEADNFDVIESLLFSEGYELNYSHSGENALKRIDLIQPDVIILDIMMPEIDGFEVCHRLKSHPQWNYIPIIAITSLNSQADMAQCLEAGAEDFIGKPVSGIELRARVRSMLRIKQQHDILQANLMLRKDISDMIVHDLRNPIAGIILGVEVMQRYNLPEKPLKKLQQIQKAAQDLQRLTNDLLLMAKIEAGKIILNREIVNFSVLTQEVISNIENIAIQKNIQIVTNFPESNPLISVDANLFRRVFDNLLSNAIKFSPAASTITVKVDYLVNTEIKVRISIADEGSGVKKELQKSIFEKYEVGNVMSGVSQIGLGLAFCKMVVESHGGRIFVEPNKPKGSIFFVDIY